MVSGGGGREAVAAAAQQGAQPGLQLVEVEGLGQVVVGTGVQAQHPVAHGAARSQDEHGRAQALAARTLQHLQAVQAGQAQIQHHGVGLAHQPLRQGRRAVGRRLHLDAAPDQRALQRGAHGVVIFYEQQLHGPDVSTGRDAGHRGERSRDSLGVWTAI